MAGRGIRAGAEKGGRWIVIRADAKRGFLLREGGFSVMRERIFCRSDCFFSLAQVFFGDFGGEKAGRDE